MSLFITLFLGVFFLVGILVIKYAPNHERIEHMSFSIAFGAMFGLLFLDLLPEIIEEFPGKKLVLALILVILGVGVLMLLDRFIPEHEEADEENPVHIGIMATIAIVLHNVIEGMTVYSMSAEALNSGMVLAIGVGLHNIPMGMLIYSALKKESKTKKYALITMASLSTFMGGLLMMALASVSPEPLVNVLMCLTLGMIIYIAYFELFPIVLRSRDRVWNLLGVLLGMAVVMISHFLE